MSSRNGGKGINTNVIQILKGRQEQWMLLDVSLFFSRSIEQYGLRYTEFLGDGDSKAFHQITEEDVYDDVKVSKLECVGHVQKRMGSRLQSLKKRSGKTHLDDGKPIGRRGRLTDNVIHSMQVYYGKAIRNNTHSVKAMQDAFGLSGTTYAIY